MWERLRSLMAELLPGWVKAQALRRRRPPPRPEEERR